MYIGTTVSIGTQTLTDLHRLVIKQILFDSRYWLFIFSLQSVVPFLVSVVLVPSSLYVTYVVSFAAGVSVAAAFLLPWWVPDDYKIHKKYVYASKFHAQYSCMFSYVLRSMLPDVVDDFKVQNPESQGHEAIFYSFYVFFTKFASGVSLGVSTLSLE